MAEEQRTLWIEVIEGKRYITTEKWPEEFVASLKWLTEGLDPRTTKWDGSKLHLWLANGNAIYVRDDSEAHRNAVVLHKLYGPDPDPVPGRKPSPEQQEALEAATKTKVEDALAKMGELMGKTTDHTHSGSGFAVHQLYVPPTVTAVDPRTVVPVWASQGLRSVSTLSDLIPDSSLDHIPDNAVPVSSLTKALMTASNPKTNLLGLTGPIPDSDGMDADLMARKIVAIPGFLDTIYERFKAEQSIRLAMQDAHPVAPIRPGMFYDSYGIGRTINTNVWAPGTFTTSTGVVPGGLPPLSSIPPTAAFHPNQARTIWSDFLADIVGFLTTLSQTSALFSSADALPNTVVVSDPLALRGEARLTDTAGFGRTQPVTLDRRNLFAQQMMVSQNLVGRARELRRVLLPDQTLTDQERAVRKVDDGILEEVTELQEIIPAESSGYAAQQTRQDAWNKWAAREAASDAVDARVEGENGRQYLRESADYRVSLQPGDKLTLVAKDGPVEAFVLYDTGRPDDPPGFLSQIVEAQAGDEGAAGDAPQTRVVDYGDDESRYDSPDAVTRDDCIRAGTMGQMGGNGQMGG